MIAVRRLVPEDVPEIVRIINANYSNSYEDIPFTPESFLRYIRDHRPTILVAVDSGRIEGAISYAMWPWGNSIDLIAADQSPQNQWIEDQLVIELEQMIKADRIYTSVEDGSPLIGRWERRGYYAEGGVYHLTIPLTYQRVVPPVGCRATIRSLRSDEVGNLIGLMNRSFGFERLGMDEVQSWWEVPGFGVDWIHVAEVDGQLVSAVVCMLDRGYSEHFGKLRGYLGPAATLPEFRNLGLTSALTITALNFLFRKGMKSAAMYVIENNNSSLGLALRVGFRIAKHWVHMNKDFP